MESNLSFPIMIVDDTILRDMIEGTEKGKEFLEKMKNFHDMDKRVVLVTPVCALQRAIYLTKPETDMKNLQKVISFLKIVSSIEVEDFTDEKVVMGSVMKVAETFQRLIDLHNQEKSK